ncbi:tail protein [Aeromonas phage phiA005]|nr:tail protein [Aeromonas phage phiA005]
MATSAGELIYTVDVDTAKAVTQARQAEKAVGALETEMNSAAAASAKLNTNLTATAKGVGQATTGMRGLSGVAGQIGFQLQDIAIQAQMGTSALVILGQQGSQVASVFGPTGAIVGAIIAVGSALLGMATASGAAGESIEELAKKADSLGKSQLEDAINKANVELNDQQQVLIKTTEKVQRMEAAQKQSGLTAGVYAVKLAEARAEQEAQSDVVNQLVANIERLTNAMYGNVDAAEASRKATQEIVSDLEFETRIMGLNEAQRATAIAQRRAGVDASSAEGKAIENAATAMVNESQRLSELDRQKRESEAAARKAASQAESEQKRLQGQYQSNENSLKKMAQQLSIAGLSTQGLAKEAAELAAVYSLGEGATQTQIEQAKQLAGALFDLNEQKRRQAEIEGKRKEAGRFVEQAAFDAASPLEQIDIEEQAKIAKLEEYRNLELISLQEFETTRNNIIKQAADERAAIELARNSMILSASSDFFGGMADLTGAFAGEQSGAYKALFAISKGFAIANAALQLQTAIANASALPWPANFPAIAQAVALGGQIASNIAGVNYGGAREFGGPVDAGKMYRVGEGGKPEIFQSGGKNFMIPGDGGKVIPNDQISGGGFSQSVQVHNYSGENVQTKTSMDGKQLDVIIGEVAKQISQRRGGVGRALASSTGTKWKAQ